MFSGKVQSLALLNLRDIKTDFRAAKLNQRAAKVHQNGFMFSGKVQYLLEILDCLRLFILEHY